MSKPLTIVEFRASNVKRLKVAHIKPDGAAVVLGGKNGQGKTSVLDSILYALGGKDFVCRQPVRKGEESAEVVLDLGEIIVRRTFTPDGSSNVTVSSREGARFPSPQAMLDRLTGRLSFDPLGFARMKPADQADTLRRSVGLDFSALDAERTQVFAERTIVNRDGQALRVRFDSAAFYEGAPLEEQSTADVLARRDAALEQNKANAALRQRAKDAHRDHVDATKAEIAAADAVQETQEEIHRLQQVLETQKAAHKTAVEALTTARNHAVEIETQATAVVDVDTKPFDAELGQVEQTNAKTRANLEHARLKERLDEKRAESTAKTTRLEAIDKEKAKAIAEAAMPVPGLAFDETGVTLNGLPFDQASQAEQLRVSVAMGFALNPRLRVLLVRDASLLDAESLALVEQMAAERGGQVWLERVEQDGATTVLIEDGTATAVAPALAK